MWRTRDPYTITQQTCCRVTMMEVEVLYTYYHATMVKVEVLYTNYNRITTLFLDLTYLMSHLTTTYNSFSSLIFWGSIRMKSLKYLLLS